MEGNAAAFAAAAQSDTIEVVDWGYCGDSSVEWGITPDGILVLLGYGTMPDYVGAQFAPWNDYKDYIYAAVVSGEVRKDNVLLSLETFFIEIVSCV